MSKKGDASLINIKKGKDKNKIKETVKLNLFKEIYSFSINIDLVGKAKDKPKLSTLSLINKPRSSLTSRYFSQSLVDVKQITSISIELSLNFSNLTKDL